MPRQMADPAYRQEMLLHMWDDHVAPINHYVNDLRDSPRGWVPYVAPNHGGVEARVLMVLRDPGPKTYDEDGSGFLCVQNDDATAERECNDFATVGINDRDVTPWNAYPWRWDGKPLHKAQLDAGTQPLLHLMTLMPHLKVLLLQGGEAKAMERRVRRAEAFMSRGIKIVPTFHPGNRAMIACNPVTRAYRTEHRRRAMLEVKAALTE